MSHQKVFFKQPGFTLLELLITVLIASILMGFAVPSFMETIEKRKVISLAEQISGHISQIRSEAISRSTDTYFVTTATGIDTWDYGLSSGDLVASDGVSPLPPCVPTVTNRLAATACTLEIDDGNNVLGEDADLILHRFDETDHQTMKLKATFSNANTNLLTFDSVRGISDSGDVIVTSENNFTLTVQVGLLGNVRICSPTGEMGYGSC